MTRRCDLTGVGAMSGNNVSKSKRRTRRSFVPNLKEVSLKSEALGGNVSLKVAANVLRTINKYGSLDSFMVNYKVNKMTDEANRISGEDGTSGGMALLFGILTCGIYYFYWNYKMGQNLVTAGKTHGKNIEDNSVLYLVLSLFGLSIVSYALIQNDLNKFAE